MLVEILLDSDKLMGPTPTLLDVPLLSPVLLLLVKAVFLASLSIQANKILKQTLWLFVKVNVLLPSVPVISVIVWSAIKLM